MLFVDLEDLSDPGAVSFHVNSVQGFLTFVVTLATITHAVVHLVVILGLIVVILLIIFIGKLKCHFRANTAKLLEEGVDHFEVGAKLDNLIDLFDFSA